MREQIEAGKNESKLRQRAIKLFQVFIVICLVDGFLDITYPLASFTKYFLEKVSWTQPNGLDAGSGIIPPEWALPLPTRSEPGINNIVGQFNSQNINVDADGMRHNGQKPPEKVNYSVFLLGASVAFGWGVADNQTISAHLEHRLKNAEVLNYAGIGQPISDNLMRWHELQHKSDKPDLVILANAAYPILFECSPTRVLVVNNRVNIFHYISRKFADTYLSGNTQGPCASSNRSLDMAVNKSVLEIENAVAFGRKQGIPFYIVYLPTPYESNVNADNLIKKQNEKKRILLMRQAVSKFHHELEKLDLPELIDLSQLLPDRLYFLDISGHLDKEANIVISEALFQRIWHGKPLPPK
jgi:hypothetical protein